MDKEKINGLVRTAVAAIGGTVIATFTAWANDKGVDIGAEQVIGIVSGAVLVIGTAVWSWVSKKKS